MVIQHRAGVIRFIELKMIIRGLIAPHAIKSNANTDRFTYINFSSTYSMYSMRSGAAFMYQCIGISSFVHQEMSYDHKTCLMDKG